MTLLGAVRRLADGRATAFIDEHGDDAVRCSWCDGIVNRCENETEPAHYPDCPWLSMPRIVAALEAAERLKDRFRDRFPTEVEDGDDDTFAIAYACCGGNFYSPHMAHCSWQALVSALTGTETPA